MACLLDQTNLIEQIGYAMGSAIEARIGRQYHRFLTDTLIFSISSEI